MDAELRYILRELWFLAWAASVQRASLYKKGIEPNSNQVRAFREKVVTYLTSEVVPKYIENGITEEQHYKHIDGLIAYARSVDDQVLEQNAYKYGVAQKLLNLALKYHWCLGLIPEPPHCPVDRIVIDKTKYKGEIDWTGIVERSDYEKIIQDIKRLAKAQGLSLSMWELSIYSRR